MNADYDRAATAAMKLLVEHCITETPIKPMPLLINYPGVRVMPFTHMADEAGVDREDLIPLFGAAFAWLFLGEPVTLQMLIAGGLILGSVAVSQKG